MDQTLHVGASVECADGPAGKLRQVIIDDTTDRVTHLVVDTHPHFGTAVLIPLAQVVGANHQRVELSCTLAQLQSMPRFEETVFLRPDQPHPTLGYLPSQYLFGTIDSLLRPLGSPAIPTRIIEQHVPEGGAMVGKDAVVEAADGPFGHVEDLRLDPATGRAEQLVVRYGHAFDTRSLIVPGPAIADITEEVVRLRFTRAELEQRFGAPAAERDGPSKLGTN